MVTCTTFCKTALKILRHIIFDSHRGKHDCKRFVLVFAIPKTGLFHNLGGKLIMRQTVA